MPRCPVAPAASRAENGHHAHEYSQRGTETSGIPHAMVLQLIRALPGDSFVATVAFGLRFCRARLGQRASEDLTPALGVRTTRFHCPLQRRSSCVAFLSSQATSMYIRPCQVIATPDAAASTASHPACLTIAIRPSSGIRRNGYGLIRTKSKQKYFSTRGLTAQITPNLAPSPR